MNEVGSNVLKKRKISKWVLASGFSFLIICVLFIIFFSLINNPKYVIKQSVIRSFKTVDKVIASTNGWDSNSVQFGASAKLGGSLLEDTFKNDEFNVRAFFDGDKLQLVGNILENNKKILNGSVLFTNDTSYIASENLLSNVYNLEKYDCDNKDNFICQYLKVDSDSSENIDDVGINADEVSLANGINSLKESILNSINKDNVFRNKGTFKDEVKEYNKYTYKLDKDTVKSIYDNLNDDAKYYIYNIGFFIFDDCNTLSEVKSKIENYISNIDMPMEINIYTDGFLNKFAGIEIGNNDTSLYFYFVNDGKKATLKLSQSKVEVNGYQSDDKYLVSVYQNNKKICDGNYRKEDGKSIWNYDFNLLGMSFNLQIINKLNTNNDSDLDGILNVSLSMESLIYNTDLNLELNYNASNNITMQEMNINNALNETDITEDDKTKMNEGLQEFYKTNFGKIINFFVGNSSMIVDDFTNTL